MGKIRIGTSNGHMPGNKSSFPREFRKTTRLHYYSRIFNSIEVNSTFYKTPLHSTFEKWAAEVPDDFRFTTKFSKEVSHAKESKYDPVLIAKFLEAASGLGNKKGCMLIQFPGKVNLQYFNHVEKILGLFRDHEASEGWQLAMEFRNQSWYISETIEMLNEHNTAMVIHDFSKAKISANTGSANFVYIRFHGPTGNYRDSYTEQVLDEKVSMIKELLYSGKDVYTYFNNTMGGAFENARYLQIKIISGQ